jgi:hypothetical protein
MPVVITCPACGKKARVPSKTVGKTVRCPRCDTTFPAASDDEAADSPEPEEVGDSPVLPVGPAAAERTVERTGVGLLALGQGLLAISLSLQLVGSLIQLATANTSPQPRVVLPGLPRPAGTVVESVAELLAVVSVVAQAGATAVVLIGAVYMAMPPTALPPRAAGGAVLVLAIVGALFAASSFGDTIRGTPGAAGMPTIRLVIGAGLQTMLAVLARGYARRQRDRAVAQLAAGIAIAYPVIVIGIYILVAAVDIFASQSHGTFEQVMLVLDRLFRTAFVATGSFVLWRVWTGPSA